LALHAAGVRKFIILHDTTVDEWDGELRRLGWNCAEYAAKTGIPESELTVGLWPAISEFLTGSSHKNQTDMRQIFFLFFGEHKVMSNKQHIRIQRRTEA
jgi:hypothetical protein